MGRARGTRLFSLGWVLLCAALLGAACAAGVDRPPVARVEGGDPERGKALLDAYGCTACHAIPEIRGADSTIGPPLTDWGQRRYIAGVLVNEPENLISWIVAPQAVKPGVAMPNLGVAPGEARDMAAYLYGLGVDEPGVLPPQEGTSTTADVSPTATPMPAPADLTPSPTATELPPDATPAATPTEAAPTEDTATPADGQNLMAMGESVYNQDCARCHGQQGEGVAGFPPHAGNSLVTGDPAPVIEIVLNGRGAMPAFGGQLSDEEVAAVISYIRNTWGNDASIVSPSDVDATR